jgi:light-regulated signal transduction histidine kinase (bacteriophytochrome)
MTDSMQEVEVRSFGEIAGEIGHELNNQLGIISGRTELARMHLDRGRVEDVRAGLDVILRQIDRMRLLSERLRGMRAPQQPLAPYDPREVVSAAMKQHPLPGFESGIASVVPVPTTWMNSASIGALFETLHSHLAAHAANGSSHPITRVELRCVAGSRTATLVITFSNVSADLGRQILAEVARVLAPSGIGIRADFPGEDIALQADFPLVLPDRS